MKALYTLLALVVSLHAASASGAKQYSVEITFKDKRETVTAPKLITKLGHVAETSSTFTDTITNSGGKKIKFTTGQAATVTVTSASEKGCALKGEIFHARNLGDKTVGETRLPVISTRSIEFRENLEFGKTKKLELGKNCFVEIRVNEIKKPS